MEGKQSNSRDLDLRKVPLRVELNENAEADQKDKELRSGDLCPNCWQGRMDYDGLLNLTCPKCGYARGGCFT